MDIIMIPLIQTIDVLIDLYVWALIVFVILGWLESFGVVNSYNRVVYTIQHFLFRITDPVLSPIRRLLPSIGGLDISPIILILLLSFFRGILQRLALHFI